MATSLAFSPAPYHIISYGTLMGTTVFHSFVNGIVMFKTVDRPTFGNIQEKLFPIYFGLQTGIPLVLAATFPGSALLGIASGPMGLLDESVRWTSLLPISLMFVCGALNLAVVGPATTKTMYERRAQAKKDGKEYHAPGPQSDDMQALNKRFGMLHGISSLINMGAFLSLVGYGFTLGSRVQSVADRLV